MNEMTAGELPPLWGTTPESVAVGQVARLCFKAINVFSVDKGCLEEAAWHLVASSPNTPRTPEPLVIGKFLPCRQEKSES